MAKAIRVRRVKAAALADPVLEWPEIPEVGDPAAKETRRDWRNTTYEERYKQQHEALLFIVRDLADEHGYDGTSLTNVVALAGVSRRTFYEHFESKDACFAELILRWGGPAVRRLIEVAERSLAEGPYGYFRAFIDMWLGLIEDSPASPMSHALAASLWSRARKQGNPLTESWAEVFGAVVDVVVVAAEQLGSPLDEDLLRLAARQQISGLIGTVHPGTDPAAERLRDQIARVLCVALGFLHDGQGCLPAASATR